VDALGLVGGTTLGGLRHPEPRRHTLRLHHQSVSGVLDHHVLSKQSPAVRAVVPPQPLSSVLEGGTPLSTAGPKQPPSRIGKQLLAMPLCSPTGGPSYVESQGDVQNQPALTLSPTHALPLSPRAAGRRTSTPAPVSTAHTILRTPWRVTLTAFRLSNTPWQSS
jgi:hypothetical protein